MDPAVLRGLADAGVVTLLLLALVGGFRGWWVYGPAHERQVADLKEDRDWWRQQAIVNGALATKSVDVAAEKHDA